MTERERQRLRRLFTRKIEEEGEDGGSGDEYDFITHEEDLIDHYVHHGHCVECLEHNGTNPRTCQICTNWDDSALYQISDLEVELRRRYIIHPAQYCRTGVAQVDILQHSVNQLPPEDTHSGGNKENAPSRYCIKYMILFTHFTNDRCIRSFSMHTGKQSIQFFAELLHLQRMQVEINYVILEKNPLLDLKKIWAMTLATLKDTEPLPKPQHWSQNREENFLLTCVYTEGVVERARDELLKPHITFNTRTVSSLQNLAKRTVVKHNQLRELAKTLHPMLRICRSDIPNFSYFLCLKFQRHKSEWGCSLNPYAINYSVDIASL